MRFAILLLSLFAILTLALVGLRVPRPYLFNILLLSAGVYGLAFFLGLGIVDRTMPAWTDGFVPYLLPIPLLALFIVWAVRRQRLLTREHDKA
jgi:hypothetical protein